MKFVATPNHHRKFAFYLLVCLLSSYSLRPPALAQNEPRRNIDWIFVLDISASMVGADGAKNIFGDVKRTLTDFIGKTSEGDSVTLYTFANDTDTTRGTMLINSELDRRNLATKISELQATGTRTHTGKAIKDALELAGTLRKRSDASSRTISIVLLSDGKEDTRGLSNVVSIPSNLEIIPKDPPYLFYVSLGEPEPEIDTVGEAMGPGKYEKVTPDNPQEIYDAIETIRKTVEKPPPPPPPQEIRLTLEPAALDFGKIEPGEQTSTQSVRIGSNVKTRARLTLEDSQGGGLSLVEPHETLDLNAQEGTTVKVRLAVPPGLPDNSYSARLTLSPVDAPSDVVVKPAMADVRVSVAHVPVWRKSLKWLAIILAALLLVVVALSLIKGEPPWIWLGATVRPDKKLEGEIEIIKPRPAQAADEFISLLQRDSGSLTLKSLLPDDATVDSDAELIALRKDGRKIIQLRRTQGVVLVNHAEVATIELFDGDIIELGEARLRFNWVGHERPADFDENT
jgi:von Willebrand factor type A domain